MKTLSKVLSPVLAMLIAFSMVVLSSCNKNGSEQERNETPTINEEQAALDLEGKMTKEELEAKTRGVPG